MILTSETEDTLLIGRSDMKIRNWGIFLFIAGYHLLLLALLPVVISHLSWAAAVLFSVTYIIGGLSITAGYHRLFAHKAYRAHPAFEWVVLLGSTLAIQWSARIWAHDHRHHHAHVDTDADPYSIKKGFWYAHIGWLFAHQRAAELKNVRDLDANPRVRFQDRYYLALLLGVNAAVFALGCLFMSPLASFYAGFLLRVFAIHHSTWCINSVAHVWGSRTFAKELSAVDNAALAFITFGEGYHNYHHAFASDYRNGVRWYHFDPTKWLIWTAAQLGLVKDRRSFTRIRLQRALVRKDKQLITSVLQSHWDEMAADILGKLDEFEQSFQDKADAVMVMVSELKTASETKRQLIKLEIRRLNWELRATWKAWVSLTDFIAERYPLTHSHTITPPV